MKINLQCPINPMGYGQASFHLLQALALEGVSLTLWPIGNISYPMDEYKKDIFQACINHQSNYEVDAPSVKIWHQFDLANHIGKGLRVGFPIFELDKFSSREIHHLKNLDRIFVCSKWAKQVIHDNSIDVDTRVVPLGVDRNIFNESAIPPESDKYIFFNIGKWEIRKGHDILFSAFKKAFNGINNVELRMMNHNPFLNEEQTMEWTKYYSSDERVKLYGRVKTQEEVAHFINSGHCGVFPTRAEGWNLEALETLSCGRSLITTNYSGHTEFVNNKNSSLLEVKNMESAYDGIWFHGDTGNWATIDVDKLADLMYNAWKEWRKNGNRQNVHGINTAKEFSWANSARCFMKGLNE